MAVVPILLILYGAIALCVIPVLSSGFNFERNYSEGWNAYHAFRAASGEVLYSGDPRHFVNYPFLSFYLVAWLKPLFGDVLTIGRALSLIALAAISGGSAVVVRRPPPRCIVRRRMRFGLPGGAGSRLGRLGWPADAGRGLHDRRTRLVSARSHDDLAAGRHR